MNLDWKFVVLVSIFAVCVTFLVGTRVKLPIYKCNIKGAESSGWLICEPFRD